RVATFSLATSRSWNDAAGSKQEKTEWHRCVVWNTKSSQLADIVERYVKKGDKIYVEGRIEYRQWTDKDGQTRYSTEINVRELIMLGGRSPSADANGDAGGAPARAKVPAAEHARGAGGAGGAVIGVDAPGFAAVVEDERRTQLGERIYIEPPAGPMPSDGTAYLAVTVGPVVRGVGQVLLPAGIVVVDHTAAGRAAQARV